MLRYSDRGWMAKSVLPRAILVFLAVFFVAVMAPLRAQADPQDDEEAESKPRVMRGNNFKRKVMSAAPGRVSPARGAGAKSMALEEDEKRREKEKEEEQKKKGGSANSGNSGNGPAKKGGAASSAEDAEGDEGNPWTGGQGRGSDGPRDRLQEAQARHPLRLQPGRHGADRAHQDHRQHHREELHPRRQGAQHQGHHLRAHEDHRRGGVPGLPERAPGQRPHRGAGRALPQDPGGGRRNLSEHAHHNRRGPPAGSVHHPALRAEERVRRGALGGCSIASSLRRGTSRSTPPPTCSSSPTTAPPSGASSS